MSDDFEHYTKMLGRLQADLLSGKASLKDAVRVMTDLPLVQELVTQHTSPVALLLLTLNVETGFNAIKNQLSHQDLADVIDVRRIEDATLTAAKIEAQLLQHFPITRDDTMIRAAEICALRKNLTEDEYVFISSLIEASMPSVLITAQQIIFHDIDKEASPEETLRKLYRMSVEETADYIQSYSRHFPHAEIRAAIMDISGNITPDTVSAMVKGVLQKLDGADIGAGAAAGITLAADLIETVHRDDRFDVSDKDNLRAFTGTLRAIFNAVVDSAEEAGIKPAVPVTQILRNAYKPG